MTDRKHLALAGEEAPAFTDEQVKILRDTVMKGATEGQLRFFLQFARARRLDPFSKQICAIPRRERIPGTNDFDVKWTYQATIDGLRATAARTGELDGQDGPYWCGRDGKWRDVWLENSPPVAARVTVFRKGSSRPYHGVARYAEYVQTTRDGSPVKMWRKMPSNQLAKCAEALALRKAFPEDLAGLYSHEEMEQASNDEPEARGRIAASSSAIVDAAAEVEAEYEAEYEDASELEPPNLAELDELETRADFGAWLDLHRAALWALDEAAQKHTWQALARTGERLKVSPEAIQTRLQQERKGSHV